MKTFDVSGFTRWLRKMLKDLDNGNFMVELSIKSGRITVTRCWTNWRDEL